MLGSGPWRLGGFEVFGREFDRDLLIVFDLLLIVVVALLLYGLSARDRMAPRGAMDVIRFVTVVAAIVLDLVVLGTMVARIGEFGFTPNRLVVFGLNLLLVVTLAGAAWHSARFLAGRAPVARLEGWQVGVLPAYGAWALAVAVLVPVLYRFE